MRFVHLCRVEGLCLDGELSIRIGIDIVVLASSSFFSIFQDLAVKLLAVELLKALIGLQRPCRGGLDTTDENLFEYVFIILTCLLVEVWCG